MEEVRIEVEPLERDEKGVLVKVRRIGGRATETLVRIAPGDDLWAAAFRAVKRLRGEQAEA